MKKKLSYHWIVVGALFIQYAATIGATTNSFNVLSPAIMKEGFSATQVQLIPMATGVLGLAMCLVLPQLLDKYGFTRMMLIGTVVAGGAMAMRSFCHSFTSMIVWAVIQGLGFCVICGVPFGIVLTNWFHESRGTATGIAASGSALGGFLFVQGTNIMIEHMGWRSANLMLAVVSTALLLPIFIFILRATPEEKGLLPYGITPEMVEEEKRELAEAGETAPDTIRGIMFKDFVKTPAFWWLCITMFVLQFSTMGVYSNINIYLQREMGHTAMFAGLVYAVVVLSQAPGKVLVGWIHDKFGVVWGSAYGLILGAVFFVFLLMAGQPAMAMIMGIAFGMRNAISSVMPPYMTAYIVGRRDYTKIFAIISIISGAACTLGPLFGGFLYDKTGSFNLAWIIFGVMFVIVFFISIITFRAGEGMDEL